jgi:hypothetical protein
VRLTLRTLLAYLDDTLEPSEIKQIGQKVAESDAAQELIARIKQVTRRRRLTTPPAGGPGGKVFDPNTVAEYLDNELDSEQLAEVEKLCLESDVHLAEIAACHQILTLVLGEPALVPPTARERMYGLVKGREAIPFRKAPVQAAGVAAGGEGAEDDFGLPRRRAAWMAWAVPVAVVCLLVVLSLALWQAISGPVQVASNTRPSKGDASKETPVKEPKGEPEPPEKAPEPVKETPKEPGKAKPPEKGPETAKQPPKDPGPAQPPDKEPPQVAGASKVGTERRELATYTTLPKTLPSMLVSRPTSGEGWQRLSLGSRVSSTDLLVSLPGSPSELRLDTGVRLQLWGTLDVFTGFPFVFESAAVINPNPGADLDFTLDRGRVYVSNYKEKGAAQVRLRFDKEVWDLTLQEPGTEVIIEFFKQYTSDIDWQSGEEPRAELYLGVMSGRVSLKVDYREYPSLTAPPGPAMFSWDNKGAGVRGPVKLDQVFPVWNKEVPTTKDANEMRVALEEISKQMVGMRRVEVVLEEGVQPGRKMSQRTLCILSLGAIDAVPTLLDILSNEDTAYAQDRNVAIFALRRWVSRGAVEGRRLFDPKAQTGLLIEKKYRPSEARTIRELLYPLGEVRRREPATFESLINLLKSEKIAIRELAFWHLFRICEGVKIPRFDPSFPPEQREMAAAEFLKLVKEGKLPPRAAGAPPAPPPPK